MRGPHVARRPADLPDDELDSLKAQGLYRACACSTANRRPHTTVDRPLGGQPVVEQLPRADHAPEAASARLEALERFGVGTGSVRTIAGTMAMHVELERRLAEFKQTEAVVVFQSGFTANAGTVSAILTKDDVVVSDALNHASIIDGCRLRRAAIKVFPHKDVDAARAILRELPAGQRKLLITDGVFSMDGDLGPLPALCDAGRGVRRDHDGGRRARQRRVRPKRPRHGRSLRHARPRGRPGRHAVEGHRRARRLRRRHRATSSSSCTTARGRSCSRRRIRRR